MSELVRACNVTCSINIWVTGLQIVIGFNRVTHRDIQFLKDRAVLQALGADASRKNEGAREELREKGIEAPGNA